MAPQPPQLRKNFGDRTANHFAVFVTQPFRAIDKLAVQKTHEVHEVRTYTNFTSFRLSCGLRRAKKPRNGGNFLDRMCNCNTVTRDAITITTWSGHPPRHPASVRTCSMWFPVHFRFLAHSLTTFGRWGCGERSDLSLDPVGIFFFCGRAVCDCGAAGGCAICWLVSVLRNRQTPPPPRKGRKRG